MPLFSFEGKSPRVHPSAFIAPTAVLVGDVTIEERASVWYNAVVRADFQPIVVRRGANVQDCAVVHVNGAQGVEIGAGATIGHNCTVHAAWLGEECLIGNGATVLDGARIGMRAMVAGRRPGDPRHRDPRRHARHGRPRQDPRPPRRHPAAEHWVQPQPRGATSALAQTPQSRSRTSSSTACACDQ